LASFALYTLSRDFVNKTIMLHVLSSQLWI
jgi:hypothetical protein